MHTIFGKNTEDVCTKYQVPSTMYDVCYEIRIGNQSPSLSKEV